MPDGRLHLISAISPPSSVSTASSPASVTQTLPAAASPARPTSAPRTLMIGGQRFLLSNTAHTQVLLTPGSVGSQKIITGLSGAGGLSRPQLLLASPSQSTVIRMPSGQHVMLRPTSQPSAAAATPQSSTAASALNPLLSAAGKSPPSTPYAVTPEVVQQGN